MIKPTTAKATRATTRIWLVEDNPADVYLLEKALQDRQISYELTRHEDGEQAIRALARADWFTPDLILLDLNLPRREGFDVLRAVRVRPSLVGVPVGILTSSNTAKDRHRVGLIGAERYIHKPPTLEEFIDQVGQAVEDLLAG
ncbi:MAG: response regulator [Terriglobales bacterium]